MAFIDTNAFKKGQLLEDSDQVSWGVEVFENRTLWGVYIYIDLPVHTQRDEVMLQRKKVLRIHMYKGANLKSNKPYELSHYAYVTNTYGLTHWSKQNKLNLIAMKTLSNFIMEHKSETVFWLKNEDLSTLSSSEKLLCIHYFIKNAHLKEFNFYYWEMGLLHNDTKEHNSELKMLDFIANHRKEKSVKKALYTSYKHAINTKQYNPHSDFIFSRTIDDPNLLVKLLSMDIAVKQNIFTDNNYLEGMELINFLKKHYTEKQICRLFVHDLQNNKQQKQYWEDILRMIQRDNAFVELERHFIKTKLSIVPLHDEIVRALHIAEFAYRENAVFVYEEQLISTQSVYTDLDFQLPTSVEELSLWSRLLHNCMFAYTESIQNGSCIIYGVFKEEKLLYAIELNEGKIVQAKAIYNQSVSQEDMKKIKAWHQQYIEFFEQQSPRHLYVSMHADRYIEDASCI